MSSPFHPNGKIKMAVAETCSSIYHTTKGKTKKVNATKAWHVSGQASPPGKRLRGWKNNTWQMYNTLSVLVITRWLWVTDVMWSWEKKKKKKTTELATCSRAGISRKERGKAPIETTVGLPQTQHTQFWSPCLTKIILNYNIHSNGCEVIREINLFLARQKIIKIWII